MEDQGSDYKVGKVDAKDEAVLRCFICPQSGFEECGAKSLDQSYQDKSRTCSISRYSGKNGLFGPSH